MIDIARNSMMDSELSMLKEKIKSMDPFTVFVLLSSTDLEVVNYKKFGAFVLSVDMKSIYFRSRKYPTQDDLNLEIWYKNEQTGWKIREDFITRWIEFVKKYVSRRTL